MMAVKTITYYTKYHDNSKENNMVTEETKQAVDVFAASTGVMSLAAWLPPVASIFTIIWLGIRIYESETVQNIVHRK